MPDLPRRMQYTDILSTKNLVKRNVDPQKKAAVMSIRIETLRLLSVGYCWLIVSFFWGLCALNKFRSGILKYAFFVEASIMLNNREALLSAELGPT